MAILSLAEIGHLILMVVGIGFIFKDMVKPTAKNYDPIAVIGRSVSLSNLKYGIMAVAPGIVLHEMMHKFVAISFGMQATFQSSPIWLGVGVVMKMLALPFIFFIPGYVSIQGFGTPLQFALIAFVGPASHLFFYFGAKYALANNWWPKYTNVLVVTRYVNGFLFIFNMLPFPPFDGASVYINLFRAFTG